MLGTPVGTHDGCVRRVGLPIAANTESRSIGKLECKGMKGTARARTTTLLSSTLEAVQGQSASCTCTACYRRNECI